MHPAFWVFSEAQSTLLSLDGLCACLNLVSLKGAFFVLFQHRAFMLCHTSCEPLDLLCRVNSTQLYKEGPLFFPATLGYSFHLVQALLHSFVHSQAV